HFFSLRMFGVEVTPTAALLYLPTYFAVAALPINVNGFGVAQLVAIACFAPFAVVPPGTANVAAAQRAAVLAYSRSRSAVSTGLRSILLQLVLGFACLRKGTALSLRTDAAVEESATQAVS